MGTESVPLLVEPEWLEQRLDAPDLVVLDCTFHIEFDQDTGERTTESGRDAWETAHIPGSRYVDIPGEFSVTNNPAYPYELPATDIFADKIGDLGVGDESRVVLYDNDGLTKAARFWWMLKVYGFETAGILNGGWAQWIAENRPVSTTPPTIEPAAFTPAFRPELVATKADVKASIDDDDVCLLNALRPDDFAGTGVVKYGRPGRIPSSVNVPVTGDTSIIDPETLRIPDRDELRRVFNAVGALNQDRVITYCGGGIAASGAAFALALLGVEDVAVYDGSLAEWGRIPTLPLETDGS